MQHVPTCLWHALKFRREYTDGAAFYEMAQYFMKWRSILLKYGSLRQSCTRDFCHFPSIISQSFAILASACYASRILTSGFKVTEQVLITSSCDFLITSGVGLSLDNALALLCTRPGLCFTSKSNSCESINQRAICPLGSIDWSQDTAL